MTRNIHQGLHWIDDCLPVAPGSSRHLHASAYVLEEAGANIIVDTGGFYHRDEIRSAVERVVGSDGVDAMILSKVHPPHAANVGAFHDEWGDPEIVATSGPPELYGFVPDDTKIAYKSREGEPLEVAGNRFEFINPPLLDVAHSAWIFHEATGTLVTADGFGHYHKAGECGFVSADFPEGIAYENVRAFHEDMLKWLVYMQPAKLVSAVKAVFDRRDVEVVAPIHGNPVLAADFAAYMDDFAESIRAIRADFDSDSRFTPVAADD